jgi:hypothetical protein
MSLLFFLSAAACTIGPLVAPPDKPGNALPAAAGYWGKFLLIAMLFQFRTRVLAIDRSAGTLLVLQRRFLRPIRRSECPLAGLRVLTTSAESSDFLDTRSRLYWIWIDAPGRPRILLQGGRKDENRIHDLVVQLSRDLQRESQTITLAEEEAGISARPRPDR